MAIVPQINPLKPNSGISDRFGIGIGGMLMPKIKHRFRLDIYGFGDQTDPLVFTQQVVTCGRPQVQFQNTALHSYNSIAYYANKPEWQPIEITLRDDITNRLTSVVAAQVQKQMNFYQQGAMTAAADYKFSMGMAMLDGSSSEISIEEWLLEGCYIEQAQYDSLDYASSDPTIITLTVRYDVATQGGEQNLPLNVMNSATVTR